MPGARSRSQKERDSIRFWREFNAAASTRTAVRLNPVGLPSNPAAAYRSLFAMQSTTPEFYDGFHNGDDFLKEFLRHFLNPGRAQLNDAHFLLGCLLELQQWGWQRASGAFVRRIFTTNFDTLLQQMLQMVGVLYTVSDRPAAGMAQDKFAIEEEEAIHLVYVHGSILRHNPANTDDEIGRLRALNATMITPWLEQRGVVVIGYGGWDDGIMEALAACRRFARGLYWCDVHPVEHAPTRLPSNVLGLLEGGPDERYYAPLGEGGASQFMAALYQAFAFDSQQPGGNPGTATTEPIQRLRLARRGQLRSNGISGHLNSAQAAAQLNVEADKNHAGARLLQLNVRTFGGGSRATWEGQSMRRNALWATSLLLLILLGGG